MIINLGIVGYRNFNDYECFNENIKTFICNYGKIDKIVSGGASGADHLAERYAKENNIPIIIHKPEWNKYGKFAGPKRNQYIIDDSTHLIAFLSPDSKGTYDSINKAKSKNIPLMIINI